MTTADDVIDSIDHALHDLTLAPDAMRWTPEPVKIPALAAHWQAMDRARTSASEMTIAITADTARFQQAMADATRRMQEVLRPLFVRIAELGPALAAMQDDRDAARRSQMHTAYRARARRRTRSRR